MYLGSNRQISTQHAGSRKLVPTDRFLALLFLKAHCENDALRENVARFRLASQPRESPACQAGYGLFRVHLRFYVANYIEQFQGTSRKMGRLVALAVLLASYATIATTNCPIRAPITLPRSHFKQLYLFNCSTNSNRLQGSHALPYHSPHDHNTTGKQGKEETEGMQGNDTELTSLSLL